MCRHDSTVRRGRTAAPPTCSSTSPALVAYLSAAITLEPGDVIITGTPAGVGPMQPGDTVEIEVEGIGVLKNPVVAEAAAIPTALAEPATSRTR